jgi:hypothetical protein
MNLQAAQDLLQARGFYVLDDQDATGQGRRGVCSRLAPGRTTRARCWCSMSNVRNWNASSTPIRTTARRV